LSNTAFALIGFIAWTLFLLVLMETIRTYLVVTGRVPANGFTPDNGNLSPFMQRLARAHANCLEGLPIFGGLEDKTGRNGDAPLDAPVLKVAGTAIFGGVGVKTRQE